MTDIVKRSDMDDHKMRVGQCKAASKSKGKVLTEYDWMAFDNALAICSCRKEPTLYRGNRLMLGIQRLVPQPCKYEGKS